jgi:Response regulator containing a CheY-like receiver domain and an HTH DNA-binding domain
MKKCKVLIVDDHDMFRSGVQVLLKKSQNIEFIGEASNGADFLELIEKQMPDVVLMDISMPVMDGIEATKQAVKLHPDIKILVLSMFGEEEYYYKMIQAGAKGFVLKSAGINELEHAITEVDRGSCFFSEELLRFVINNISKVGQDKDSTALSAAEKQMIMCLAQNQSDEEIADNLNIAVAEIQPLRQNLLQKTGSSNTAALIMYAIKNEIISI